jgi:hypothetical protein
MNFPAAVIAAMALCNQHVVATSSSDGILFSTSGVIGGCNSMILVNGETNCHSRTAAESRRLRTSVPSTYYSATATHGSLSIRRSA